jgi:hypothetical protein
LLLLLLIYYHYSDIINCLVFYFLCACCCWVSTQINENWIESELNYYHYYYYYYYYYSTAICWALASISVFWFYTQSEGLLEWGIGSLQGLWLYTEQHKHRINSQNRHPFLELDSKPRSQRSSERKQFMPYTVQPLWLAK